MFRNVRYKTLALFCLTFIVGLISSDIYQPIITVREKESPKNITVETSKSVEEALELLGKNKLECVSVDGSLKYHLIKEESIIPASPTNPKADKLAKLLSEILEIEKELKKNEKLSDEEKSELRVDLETLIGQKSFYNPEKYGIIDEKDLLYREVCKEIK